MVLHGTRSVYGNIGWYLVVLVHRLSQLAELSHGVFDPELFSHSAYVNFFVTFATKVSYLTFCDKMWQFFI